MNLDLNLLKCFRVVAEVRSISKASSILHISQPALSLQIKRLEDQIGKKIFDRHNRGLVLTKFGEQLLVRSMKLQEIENQLTDLIQQQEDSPRGTLKIGTYTTASSYLLADKVADFLTRNTEVSVQYQYDQSKSLLEKIKNNTLDCAILTDVPEDKGLDIQPFFQDELIYAVSSKRKEAKLKQINPKQLSEIDFLSYPLRHDLCYRKVEYKFGAHLAKARVVLETESFDTLKQMLLRGVGATFIPRYLVKNEIEKGQIAEIQVGNVKLPITFCLITKNGDELSPLIRLFQKQCIQ